MLAGLIDVPCVNGCLDLHFKYLSKHYASNDVPKEIMGVCIPNEQLTNSYQINCIFTDNHRMQICFSKA